MPLEPALLGYAGLALLAGARGERHHLPFRLSRGQARIAAIACLILSLIAAFMRFGPYQGTVAWLGLLSLGGIVLVLLLSRWKHPPVQAAPAVAAVGLLLWMI